MDFTEIYKQSSNLVSFSPGAHFILIAVQDRLIIRRSDSFQITRTWQLDSSPSPTSATLNSQSSQRSKQPSTANNCITHAGWSYDSEYVFAASAKRGVVHVLQLRDENWNARIDAGAEGLVKAEWAPDGRSILCFSEWGYKLYVITLAGKVLASFTPDPEPALGIREVGWHPTGAFLAVCGWDDRIYILDSMSWSAIVTFEVSGRIPSGVTLWREPSNWQESTEGRGFLSYDKVHTPSSVSTVKPDHTKPHPKSGIAQLEWNKTGTVLLARLGKRHFCSFPSSEESFNPSLRSILIHSQPVVHCRWNPVRPGSLVVCCGSRGIYTWSDEWQGPSGEPEEVAECIGVPAKQFDTRDIRWAPDGKGLVLLDKEKFCCAFEVEEEAPQ
ncbi:hypothetical protein PM082_002662 [Marasmius tenuissimus]|nr:hypothetical protein PM082_002662 [Marasmius tenuissimus]